LAGKSLDQRINKKEKITILIRGKNIDSNKQRWVDSSKNKSVEGRKHDYNLFKSIIPQYGVLRPMLTGVLWNKKDFPGMKIHVKKPDEGT